MTACDPTRPWLGLPGDPETGHVCRAFLKAFSVILADCATCRLISPMELVSSSAAEATVCTPALAPSAAAATLDACADWSGRGVLTIAHELDRHDRVHTACMRLRMADRADTANVVVHPPIAWALALLAGWAINLLTPLPFIPAGAPTGWAGAMVFALAVAVGTWSFATMTRAGSNVPTNLPTTTIVDTGPYRLTRNPIYLGMMLGLIGEAIAFNSLWPLATLVPFALVIRYGVVAREEAYLERKFGDDYRRYRARVRRWL